MAVEIDLSTTLATHHSWYTNVPQLILVWRNSGNHSTGFFLPESLSDAVARTDRFGPDETQVRAA